MEGRKLWPYLAAICCLVVLLTASGAVRSEEMSHSTRTDFDSGTFFQTLLYGDDQYPEIALDTYTSFNWAFYDDDISGWSYAANETGNVAEENPAGQIHLAAQFVSNSSGSYALAHRTDVAIPDRFTVEYLVYIDAVEASGVADPFIDQPTGACCRFDVLRTDVGFRADIFSDRVTSFYRVGTTGIDYPVNASIDITTNTGRWYTFRFDIDFSDPDLPVQVYRDGSWIGELKADTRNASAAGRIRPMAFSRGPSSGLVEYHVDRVRAGSITEECYSSGSYTSAPLEIQAASLDSFSWSEVPPDPCLWETWTKYGGNPVLAGPALGENILADIEDPLQQPVLYDGKYWLCYSSGGPGQAVHLAHTTDSTLTSWTDYASNPVLAPQAGEVFLFSPHLFKSSDTYYLFFDVSLESDSRQRIAYATAPSPTGPWTRGQIVLDRGAAGDWDDYRAAEPFVVKEEDTYFLYYMGDHDCSGCAERIGVATTTEALFPLGAEAGGEWTKHGIVLSPDPDPAHWDGVHVSNPSVVKEGNVYLMRYSGSIDNVTWRAGAAWATNPYGPYTRLESPDIDLGPSGSWDDVKVLRGAVHYHNGQWYCVYTGSGETSGWTGYQTGIATADPKSIADVLAFETRTSPDGATWEEWLAVANGGAPQSTPDEYFQYRAAFSASPGDPSPVLTDVYLKYDQQPVSALLSLFTYEIEEEAVRIRWSATVKSDSKDFELLAVSEGTERVVPHTSLEKGIYSALDTESVERGEAEVVYILKHRSGGGEWQQIYTETVTLESASFAVKLHAPYPNPFNPATTIGFTLNKRENVQVTVYDVSGKRVAVLADRVFAPGYHTVLWQGVNHRGESVSSGIYFVRMITGKYSSNKRIVLMR